jgi:hypothetical protein
MSATFRRGCPRKARFSNAALVLNAFTLIGSSGCYNYAVAAREPPPNSQMVAIDRNNPQTSTQWQFAWGLTNEPVFSPIVCTNGEKDAAGNCLHGSIDPCHGKGIGFYEVNVPWYMLLTTGVTLGIVSGVRTTFYCATSGGSESGPQAISGPH